ncbi:MAG: hypothetical protein U5K32_02125 [Bacteroidales bacterium]|nr:hypothetical protein [Bacteroidales bacterium]
MNKHIFFDNLTASLGSLAAGKKNTFYNIFINTGESVEANLIVVRSPFHNCRLSCYQQKITELKNFVAIL